MCIILSYFRHSTCLILTRISAKCKLNTSIIMYSLPTLYSHNIDISKIRILVYCGGTSALVSTFACHCPGIWPGIWQECFRAFYKHLSKHFPDILQTFFQAHSANIFRTAKQDNKAITSILHRATTPQVQPVFINELIPDLLYLFYFILFYFINFTACCAHLEPNKP